MNTFLMCKDIKVYDVDNNIVLNELLLPGYMKIHSNNKAKFASWLKLRYSSNTNSFARKLKGVTFGQGNRLRIDKYTHALSLSDSYWLKQIDDEIKFKDVSPYYNNFWTGEGYYQGQSIPTLYVPGYLNKYWVNSNTLCKTGENVLIEVECSRVCRECGIPVNDIIQKDDNSILIKNITNTKYMLEQADQSGLIDPDNFDNTDIIKYFGIKGLQMIVIDAIFGNGDRHAGNFGWLRDTDTGEYVCMAPLYDFDHALDSKLKIDILIRDAIEASLIKNEYTVEALRIANKVIQLDTIETFRLRAFSLIEQINKNIG